MTEKLPSSRLQGVGALLWHCSWGLSPTISSKTIVCFKIGVIDAFVFCYWYPIRRPYDEWLVRNPRWWVVEGDGKQFLVWLYMKYLVNSYKYEQSERLENQQWLFIMSSNSLQPGIGVPFSPWTQQEDYVYMTQAQLNTGLGNYEYHNNDM